MPEAPVLPEWFARVDPDRPQPVSLFGTAPDCAAAPFGPDQQSLALFAGFIFDRDQLAHELELNESCSNVQFLVAGWHRWREDLFDHLDGNYMVAIWEADSKTLTLGRDAMGFYGLYYAVHKRVFWFSPNVLTLAHCGRLPCVPNRQSLALRLVNSTPSHGETFFEGILRIPPGQRLSWRQGESPLLSDYWDPLPVDDEPWLPDQQVRDQFEPRLQQAVDRCLQLSPNGMTFSGGLDSSTIAVLAASSTARLGRSPMTAFSAVSPPGFAGDDGEPWQKPVTRFLRLPHRTSHARERLGDRTLMEANLEEIPRLPAPTMVWWVGAFLSFYRQIAQEGGHTLLTGNGGDDWLGVPEWWAADLLRAGRLRAVTRFLSSYVGSGGRSWRYGARELLWRRGLRTLMESQWSRVAPEHTDHSRRERLSKSIPTWLCPSSEDRHDLVETLHQRRASLAPPSGGSPPSYLRLLNRYALASPFVQFERERNFHEERMVGLVFLHPFLDRRWIEFASRISPECLLHGGQYKGLLRPILASHLPGIGIETQRKGYPASGEGFFEQSLAASLPGSWSSSSFNALEELSLIDPNLLPRDLSEKRASHNQLVHLFTVVSTQAWVASHF